MLIDPGVVLPQREDSDIENVLWEGILLGVYLSHHPVEVIGADKNYFDSAFEVTSLPDRTLVSLVCIIESVKVITTKRGDQMAFLVLCDGNVSRTEATVFPRTYSQYAKLLEEGRIVHVLAFVQNTDERQGLIVENISDRVSQYRLAGTEKVTTKSPTTLTEEVDATGDIDPSEYP